MGTVLAAAGAYLLFRLRFVLVTITLAAMLAYAILPLVEFTDRLRVAGRALPRFASVTAVFIALILLGAGGVIRAAGPIGEEARRLVQNAGAYRDQATVVLSRARTSLAQSLPPALRGRFDEAIDRVTTFVLDSIAHALQATTEWLSHIAEIVMIPILAFYFLVDLPALKEELVRFLPGPARGPVLITAHRLGRIVAAYVKAQILLMTIAGIVVWAGLSLIGMRFTLLLGLLAGITRAIPIVGPLFAAIPIVGLAALQSPTVGIAVLIFFIALQVVESKVVLPLVTGRALDLHGATVLIAILAGNALFGLVGVFLAAPVAAFAKEFVTLAETGFADPAGP